MRSVLFESGYWIGIDRGCSHDPLGQHDFLRIPSNPTSKSGVENSSRQCHRDIINPVVAETTLVYHSPSTIQRNVSSAPNNSSVVNTAERSDQASRFEHVEADGLAHQLIHMTDSILITSQAPEDLAQRTVQKAPPSNLTTTASVPTAVDQEIQVILESALRPSTHQSYVAKWKRFSSFAERHSFPPGMALIENILQFFLELYHSGLKPSSVKVYAAAISHYRGAVQGSSVFSQPLVQRFIRGLQNLLPSIRPAMPTWSLSVVLQPFTKPPFEPLATVDLRLEITTPCLVTDQDNPLVLEPAGDPNTKLLRKRHIGNDIVTIVFQEPGALPFTPKNIRSHFQHVFVIVKVHNPCTENVCYSVGVSRSKDVPPFGPPIPKGVTFPKSAVFRDFLLAKVINAENAAHKSEKFRAMATRTRQEYLKDLAENFVTTATVDTSVKFSFITLGAKKKERVKPRKDAHLFSVGAVIWNVIARDFGQSLDIECLLGISNEFIVLIEKESKNVVFNCSCRDVIGWTSGLMSVKVFYERGECILLSALDNCADDIREIVQRLEIVTRGCETTEMTLRRNGLGQLGFHVNFEGIVADVEPFGFAWKAGLRQGSRLVEICKVAVATLSHEQMIDLLRTSVTVKVVIIQPHEDGSPRRGCSELCRIPMVEYKLDSEGTPCEYKTPFRRNTTWHRVPTPAGQPLSRASPILGTSDRLQCQQLLQQAQTAIPRSTSFDRKLPDGARCQSPLLHDQQGSGPLESEGGREHEDSLEGTRHSSETKWHAPSTKVLSSYKDRALQKENSGKDSPNKFSHIGDKTCSSHSSSNTLSSNTSSNSDDKHFGSEDLMDTDLLGLTYIKGASTDSGIDTTPCMPAPILVPLHLAGSRSGMHSRTDQWAETTETSGPDEDTKMYAVHSYASAISSSHTGDGSMADLSEISSHSSGSHHSGSPSAHGHKSSGSLDTSKVYIVSQGQPIPGSVTKCYPRQGAISKYVIGWKKLEGSPTPEESEASECQEMYNDVDGLTSSRLQDSGRNTVLENQRVLSKEEFLKLMMPDSISVEEGRRKASYFLAYVPIRSNYAPIPMILLSLI
ncbi:Signal-induced proliferation-associated 1-like protein 2 [Varanus komodoensis]|nr:Signal-induced proliferation-associated 1-like protein 2 [Varanus komodoensis]